MILRRYGTSYQSVVPNFEAKALNEIGFRRDHATSIPVEDFEARYRAVESHELSSRGEGDVQNEAEQTLLDDLLEQLEALESELGEGDVLVVESEQGHDWPKTRQKQENVVVEGENRLYFHVRVEPPLRIGTYRAGDG